MNKARAFNDKLDQLLRGATVEETSSQAEYESLVFAYELAQMEFSDEIVPRPDLQARWRAAAQTVKAPQKNFMPAWSVRLAALGSAVALILVLLLAFREPVMASLGRLLGYAYFPQVGFVRMDTARVLRNAVAQVHEGQELTVERGLIGERDTQLWVAFNDEARSVEGAWLETPDGQRYDLQWWDYEPDVPGTKSVHMSFEALPPDATNVVLALPEGWRVPLAWVAAEDSDLPPADLPVSTGTPTPEEQQPTPETTPTVEALVPCVYTGPLNACVKAAARTQDGLEVLLEGQPNGDWLAGSENGMNLVDSMMASQPVLLMDSQGNVYSPKEFVQTMEIGGGQVSTTLKFDGAQDAVGPFRLLLPALYARLPLDQEIVVELGASPAAGQLIPLDATVDVAGIPVHFSQATLESHDSSSLTLRLTSDLLESRNGITPFVIELGKPDVVQDRYGYGGGSGVLDLRVELMQPSGLVTGEVRLPLIGATVLVNGPFNLSFDSPQAVATSVPTPEVIDGGDFIPLPTGQPLLMDAFSYSGRGLQANDLLVVAAGETNSTLLVGNLPTGMVMEPLATLPGQVMAVYPHADRQGLDYVTGLIDPARGNQYQQLYTLRFVEGQPRMLVGAFGPLAYGFTWSYDGRWLAYTAPRSEPGASEQNEVWLIDLDRCRPAGNCASQALNSPENLHLYGPTWSPTELRLLVQGAPPEQNFGMGDIFSVTFNPQDGSTSFVNLTASAQIDDWAPQWRADGAGIMYACWKEGLEINTYALCQNDLTPGVDKVAVELLPFNMKSILLGKDGQTLIDRMPVAEEGALHLRQYNIATGEAKTLIEWPAFKGEFTEPSLSPDRLTLAVVEPGLTSLVRIDLQSAQATTVYTATTGAITWNGWVK